MKHPARTGSLVVLAVVGVAVAIVLSLVKRDQRSVKDTGLQLVTDRSPFSAAEDGPQVMLEKQPSNRSNTLGASSDTLPPEGKEVDAPVRPQGALPKQFVTPLESRLFSVADTFYTDNPDVSGLLDIADMLAAEIELVPESAKINEQTGAFSGTVKFGARLTGSVLAQPGGSYSIELLGNDSEKACRRQLTIQFEENDGMARGARVRLQSYPDRRADSENLGGKELQGWRVEIDPVKGARAIPTMTLITAPVGSDSYLYETNDHAGHNQLELPGMASANTFDLWRQRLLSLKSQ